MKQIIKVGIGANFGDCGKGLWTDYWCNKLSENERTLNVRFNGGAQAGHTVVTPDGLRHVFNHIGSGSFNPNVVTYLSRHFIINPILFRKEYEKLEGMGVKLEICAHPDCIVTFPYDMMINQIVEKARGNDRHGSCGVGIYETIIRNNKLFSPLHMITGFLPILEEAVQNYVPFRLKELGVENIPVESMELLNNKNILSNYLKDLEFLMNHILVRDESIYARFQNIVFEGAQGLLLDKDNKDYFPHLTPSNTGLKNVNEQISLIPMSYIEKDIEVCFITRSYFTRHGAGKFLTECSKDDIAANLVDLTNHTNEFQGNFRYGYFDFDTFKTAVDKELAILKYDSKPTIMVTHLDETKEKLVTAKDKGISIGMLEQGMNIPVAYTSRGMTRNTITDK